MVDAFHSIELEYTDGFPSIYPVLFFNAIKAHDIFTVSPLV